MSEWQKQDVHAWHILSPLIVGAPYLPWGSGSMRPAGMVITLNEIALNSSRSIVECGSGVSTLIIARYLKGVGGNLYTIEHDSAWADFVEKQLESEGLNDIVTVVRAPLTNGWYNLASSSMLPDAIDLLIVDGPPAWREGSQTRRAPALPYFNSSLTSGALVVLDDIDRIGEQEIIAAWNRDWPWAFELVSSAGVALGRRR